MRERGDEEELDRVVLADDDLAHLVLCGLAKVVHAVEARLVGARSQNAQIVVSSAHPALSTRPSPCIQRYSGGPMETPPKGSGFQEDVAGVVSCPGQGWTREQPAVPVEHRERAVLE